MEIIYEKGINDNTYAVITNDKDYPYHIVHRELNRRDLELTKTSDFVVFARAITNYSDSIGYERLLDISKKTLEAYRESYKSDAEEFIEDVLELDTNEKEVMGAVKKLSDYFSWDYVYNENEENDDDFLIKVEGVVYPYEMSISPYITDDICCRVKINDEYYYFG